MTVEFNCPHCQTFLRTAVDKSGLQAKCPSCSETITIPTSDQAGAATDQFDPIDPLQPDSRQQSDVDIHLNQPQQSDFAPLHTAANPQSCPMCGAEIEVSATRCRFCGEDLTEAPRARSTLRPTVISAGDVLSDAWNTYKDQMGLCIGSVVLVFTINFVVGIPGNIIKFMIDNGNVGQDTQALMFALLFLFLLLSVLIQVFVIGGQHILLLKIARGKRAEITDLFKGGRFYWRILGNGVVFILVYFVGILACIVPGIIVLLMYWPFLYVLVDTNAPGLNSLSIAKDITRNNWGSVLLLILVQIGLFFMGLLMCGVGLLITGPLCALIWAVTYVHMTGQRTAVA